MDHTCDHGCDGFGRDVRPVASACDYCHKPSRALAVIGRKSGHPKHICPDCQRMQRPSLATDPRLAVVRPDPRPQLPPRRFGHRG